jgi:methionyl-tRNA formyltransferase
MRCFLIVGTKRGYLTLKALVENGANVVGVISQRQDEHEIERFEGPIRELAGESSIPHFETKWFKDRDYAEVITASGADITLVVGCRVLIPKQVYEAPRLGTLAVHDSFLPEYRGFAPLNWAIINGEDHTGVTLFYVTELMDGGDIVGQKRVPIYPSDAAPVVYSRVCEATVELVLECYPQLASASAALTPQDYREGTLTCSRTPADGIIDWSRQTKTLFDQVRALTWPYPGAYTYYNGRKLIIWTASCPPRIPNYVGRIPGRVVAVAKQDGYADVLTGDGILRIGDVQLEGEDRTVAANVIRSVRVALGLRTEDLLERVRSLEDQLARALSTST